MNITNFISSFPEIKEKNDKYYLFRGIIFGLDSSETLSIINSCLTQGLFKRKILLNKIVMSAPNWSRNVNDHLFERIYSLFDSLKAYFKKESASMMLFELYPHISVSNQRKILHYFLESNYKNNHERAYVCLLDNWHPKYQEIIEKIWRVYKDKEIINLLVTKMPRDFLLKNFKDILCYFEEDINYDFHLKVLRNKFYARIVEDIPSEIKRLKVKDPISYIFIMKECGKKIDPAWAIEIYKKLPQSRKYLPRWYSEMGLWKEILKENQNLLCQISTDTSLTYA